MIKPEKVSKTANLEKYSLPNPARILILRILLVSEYI
jgi:hypothetical protein